MKKIINVVFFFLGITVMVSAAGISEEARRGNERADMSYALGMLVGEDFLDSGLRLNYDAFTRGLRDTMENRETLFTIEEAIHIINAAFMAAQAEMAAQNLADGLAFLAENAKRPEIVVTPSGLQLEFFIEGDGDKPGPADTVLVNYHGTLIDGTIFDSTLIMGEPMWIPLDRVIPGWAEGLVMMREGSMARLYIPPDLAYGVYGAGGIIAPNSVIIFDIELITIRRPDNDN